MSAPAEAAPAGVVTFLFTDVEGSTRRWETDAEAMRTALAAHDGTLRETVAAHGGFLFKHTGDGICAAFSSPRSAVDILRHDWYALCALSSADSTSALDALLNSSTTSPVAGFCTR